MKHEIFINLSSNHLKKHEIHCTIDGAEHRQVAKYYITVNIHSFKRKRFQAYMQHDKQTRKKQRLTSIKTKQM